MASRDLKLLASRVLADMAKTAENAEKDARKQLERQKGQILIINKTRFSTLLTQLVPSIKGTEGASIRKEIWDEFSTRLKALEGQVPKERLAELKTEAENIKGLRKNDNIFFVKTYASAKRAKGKLLQGIIKRILDNRKIAYSKDSIGKIGGAGNKFGAQLGHEEAGKGVATSTLRAARAAQILSNTSLINEAAQLRTIITQYEQTLGLTIEHSQIVNANLGLKKSYVPVLSWQKAIGNNTQAQLERSAIQSLTKEFEKVATLKGSTPLITAVSEVLLDTVAPKKSKVTGKRKKQIKEKSKGTETKKVRTKRVRNVVEDSSLGDVSLTRGGRSGSSSIPLKLIGLFNRDLPKVLEKNMMPPALQYRSGRFASSVSVVDVQETTKGFLSFGYIYDKYPYQTFEPGFAQGSVERDPRRLIDSSMREIAAQYAIGRFYTRRV